MKIQKGDMVKVISGKDAGKEGKVLADQAPKESKKSSKIQ